MHWRTVISGLVIMALLPVSSLAAICNTSCRMTAMPARSTHTAEIAIHHHHRAPGTMPQAQVGTVPGTPHQLLPDHKCCNDSTPEISGPCLTSETNDLQEQTSSPRFFAGFGVVQNHNTLITKDDLNQRAPSLAMALSPSSRSLTLRI